ncbi:endoglucanase [Treponema sp. R8-4-B8]
MKIKLILIFMIILAACSSNSSSGNNTTESKPVDFSETGTVEAAVRSAPFSKGFNYSEWFESNNAGGIPFTKFTEQNFIDIKSLGADVIRLPIKMHNMTGGAPNYTLDPLLVKFLKTAVDWAEKHEIYIIIDNHSFDPILPTSTDVDKILIPVWEQIARLFKDRGSYVLYEILNEPHGISDARWGEIQGKTIEAIRRIDGKHTIIVGGTDYNSIKKLNTIPKYSDANLIYTFHFYDPFIFTHQGATWGEPSMAALRGVPFPYIKEKMPKVPANLRGTWIETAIANYSRESAPSALYASLNRVIAFSNERNVPVFCGEFGVYIPNSPKEDRVTWYKIVSDALDKRNISRASWDYFGGFGIFNSNRRSFNHDLNTEVVRAMGYNPPAQIERVEQALNSGFVIYDDYPNNEYVSAGFWGNGVDFSLYDANSAQGEFAIRWGNTSQYDVFYFDIDNSIKDFSLIVNNGFNLEFKARTQTSVNFDVRFLNSEAAIPWRIRYTINEAILPPDGKWHVIKIPLARMTEHGAWVNATQKWLSPEGKFSWKDIQRLEFVSENGAMKGISIWFDDIKISN